MKSLKLFSLLFCHIGEVHLTEKQFNTGKEGMRHDRKSYFADFLEAAIQGAAGLSGKIPKGEFAEYRKMYKEGRRK